MSPRLTDWSLALAALLALLTGLISLVSGHLGDWFIFALHGAAGLWLLLLLWGKLRRVWPRLIHLRRWDRRTVFGLLALLVVLLRASRPMREGLTSLVLALLITLPWLIHQVTTYGLLDPLASSRHAMVVLDQPRFPGFSLQYVADFATTTFHSFWAQFGWMGIVAPDRLYWAYGVWILVAVMGLLRARRCFIEPAWQLLLAVVLAALVALVGYNVTFIQFQGRYLFTALVPIAALCVLGWAAWLPARGAAQLWGVLLVGALLVGLNAYALMRVLVPGFAPTG